MIRKVFTQHIEWQGITIAVSYEPNWLDNGTVAHLRLQSVAPRAPLPMTETGYRSHFLPPDNVTALGGPLAYARAWLDQEAQSKEWNASQDAARQLSLF